MDLEKHKERFAVRLANGSETELFRAIFREEISVADKEDRTPTEEAIDIAAWPDRMGPTMVTTRDPLSIIEKITSFIDRTGEIVSEIPEITRIPGYRNEDVAQRYRLKKRAQALEEQFIEKLEAFEYGQDGQDEHAASHDAPPEMDSVLKDLDKALEEMPSLPDSESS